MKNILNTFKNGKYLSLTLLIAMLCSYLTTFRYYIYENVYKAYALGSLGPFGSKLSVSIIVVVFLALGFALGAGGAILFNKKANNRAMVWGYGLTGFLAVVMLLFNPYNLQLLMPSSNMQNIAMINCIALMVFGLIDVAVFSLIINLQIMKIVNSDGLIGLITLGAAVAFGILFSVLTVALKWSLVICLQAYGWMLVGINVLHAVFVKNEENEGGETINLFKANLKTNIIVMSVLLVVVIALLITGFYVTKPLIAIPNL